jgi:FkbM family methyltransferase
MKSFFKKILRLVDLELRNFSIEKSENARFFTMLSHHKVNTIFDIGANEGQFGVILRNFGYKGKIISFEPLSDARESLLNISRNDPMWQIALQAAIGEENGEIEIQIAGNSQSSSVLDMLDTHVRAAPDSKYIGKEKVALRKLDSIAADYMDSNSIAFIKIDTQGYETQVMNGAKKLMSQIVGLQVEISLVPLYKGQCLFDEMLKKLKNDGFELWSISTVFSDPNTAQVLQVDATFFRTPSNNSYEKPF